MIDSFITGNTPISGAQGGSFSGAATLGPAPTANSCGPLVQFSHLVGTPPPVPTDIRPDLFSPGGENSAKKA